MCSLLRTSGLALPQTAQLNFDVEPYVMITKRELQAFPTPCWMPSRIPVRDALVAFVPNGVSEPEVPRSVYETRLYPHPGGGIMKAPYDGGPFDSNVFRIEAGAWDHTTCDLCNKRIPAMILCYVTKEDPYHALCESCFSNHVTTT